MEQAIIKQAEKNAEQYDTLFRKAARAAFIEGAKWYQYEMDRKSNENGN